MCTQKQSKKIGAVASICTPYRHKERQSSSSPGAANSFSGSIKSFVEYKSMKGNQWHSRVKCGKQKSSSTSTAQEQSVSINIGLLEWNEKDSELKPKRGKKVRLRCPSTASSLIIRLKAQERWKAFHSNLYDDDETYCLLYEDGQKVLFLPGSSELFSLNPLTYTDA